MPRLPPSLLGRLGRGLRSTGSSIRPAVPFVLGTGAVALGGSLLIHEATRFRAEGAPPLQTTTLDTDPSKPGDETQLAFDRRTGRLLVWGEPSSEQVGPERSQERTLNTTILVAGVVGIAALFLLIDRGGK